MGYGVGVRVSGRLLESVRRGEVVGGEGVWSGGKRCQGPVTYRVSDKRSGVHPRLRAPSDGPHGSSSPTRRLLNFRFTKP